VRPQPFRFARRKGAIWLAQNGRGLNEVGAVFSSDGMTIQFDRGAVWEQCVPLIANI
jgi:hypothetical protein